MILDELGYVQLGPGAAPLFQSIAERYESGSTIVTSNLEFSRWEEVFGDAVMTAALLDRLTHRCHILVFDDGSYRLKESRRLRITGAVTTAVSMIRALGTGYTLIRKRSLSR